LAGIGMASSGWQTAFAVVGAVLSGFMALSRLAGKEGPARRTGRGLGGVGLLAVLLAAARPDQGEALAVLVVEQVGEDRVREARVVQLEREVVAALAGAL